jgi:hypothetical protein
MNKPTMVVIPNYRTMSFGVMGSREILEAGNTRMPIYTYRFNQRPWNNMEVDVATIEPVESTHGHEEKSLPAWDVVAARSDSAQKLPRR